MSSLEFARRKKPESVKLIRQLVCFLFLQNDKQLMIERFLEPAVPQEFIKATVQKQYRTFYRYIGEICSCLEDDIFSDLEEDEDWGIEDLEIEDWDVFYLNGIFYRGYDFAVIDRRKADPFVDLKSYSEANQVRYIRSIEPSSAHQNRLMRTMILSQAIVSRLKKESKYEFSSVCYFQTVFWPKFKSDLKDMYVDEFGLEPRTVQRDMYAVFSAASQYLEMSEFRNRK